MSSLRSIPEVAGLVYVPDYVTGAEEQELLDAVGRAPWLSDLSRRVQHYGWRYDYKARSIEPSSYLENLPEWAARLAARMHSDGLLPHLPNQAIVNEYEPNQGIGFHTDCVSCFADGVASLSTGSACVMNFTEGVSFTVKASLVIEPRSLVVMTGDARYRWLHGINRSRVHHLGPRTIVRDKRVSLTFRKVLLET